ncbi:MAG: methionine--tRNA ligase [Candidatus Micrarchaeia archaeon]
MGKFYITTAIPYVNAAPHIGHALEFVQTDAIARYRRLRGDDVALVTGADENSLKNVQAAEAKGITPQQLCEQNAALFRKMADAIGLSYTSFVRTSVSQGHFAGVRDMWERCARAGDIYKKNYRGLYCVGCEAFLTESELVDGMCPEHKKVPEVVEEENYFFRLSKYQKRLEELIESGRLKVVPESRMNEMLHFVREGLEDFSISRSVKRAKGWGVPVPGDESQIMYVWFDALGTYITGIGYGSDKNEFKRWWPADAHVIGKGILRFHAIYWPAMLLSMGEQLPTGIMVHGYVTVEGQKMSKSLGNIVDPMHLIEKYGQDAVRYCLLSEISTFDDGDFSERALAERNNNELVANLGNLANRVFIFTHNNFDGHVPSCSPNNEDIAFMSEQKEKGLRVSHLMDSYRIKDALAVVMEFSSSANKYFQQNEPWKLIKSDRARAATVMAVLINQVKDLAILIEPFMPHASAELFRQLGISPRKWDDIGTLSLKEGHALGAHAPLFRKIEVEAAAVQQKAKAPQAGISIDDVCLEVGEIISVEKHPNAEKLLIERVRMGTGGRQIVSGLVGHYTPEQLVGKKVIIVANLKPAVLRGVKSEGMLLAAESAGAVEVLELPAAEPGARAVREGGTARDSYREITINEFQKVPLEIRNGVLYSGDKRVLVSGQPVKTLRISNGNVC